MTELPAQTPLTDQPAATDDLLVIPGDHLTPEDVYGMWKIRDAVFAVEQQCDEEDVDDRDLLPTATHLWLSDGVGFSSYVRSYVEDGVRHIGRVCTRKDRRGNGLSGQLMDECITMWGDDTLVLNAQAYLEQWYGRYGFVRSGDNFMEAGIDHVPMARAPQQSSEQTSQPSS